MTSYADDTVPNVYRGNISSTIEPLQKASDLLFQWLSDNHMKTNEEKYHWLS